MKPIIDALGERVTMTEHAIPYMDAEQVCIIYNQIAIMKALIHLTLKLEEVVPL